MSAEQIPPPPPAYAKFVDPRYIDAKYIAPVTALATATAITSKLLQDLADVTAKGSGHHEIVLILNAIICDPENPETHYQQCATSSHAWALIGAGLVAVTTSRGEVMGSVRYAPNKWFAAHSRLSPGDRAAIQSWVLTRLEVASRGAIPVPKAMKNQQDAVITAAKVKAAKQATEAASLAQNAANVAAFKEAEAAKTKAPTEPAAVAPAVVVPVERGNPRSVEIASTMVAAATTNAELLAAATLALAAVVQHISALSVDAGMPPLELTEIPPPAPTLNGLSRLNYQLRQHVAYLQDIEQQMGLLTRELK